MKVQVRPFAGISCVAAQADGLTNHNDVTDLHERTVLREVNIRGDGIVSVPDPDPI
jgi:hypothetical protein